MAAQLRVLLDASCLGDGRAEAGIGRYARGLIDALGGRDDIEIQVAIPERPPLTESRPWRWLRSHPTALRAARRFRPHLVHGLGGEALLGLPGSRQVVTVHDVEMWRMPPPRGPRGAGLALHRRVVATRLRGCAGWIAVSRTSAEEAAQTLGLEQARIRVVPSGAEAAFTATAGAEDAAVLAALGVRERGYILWSGSLRTHDPRKQIDALIGAVAQLNNPVPLVLAGAAGDEAERVRRLAAATGVSVIIAGRRDDAELAALYRGAAVLALCSLHEGFGFPVLEAMACGSPVVATAVGNIPDLTAGAALLVPAQEPEALSAALASVLSDAPQAERMRAAGLRRAADFTWAACAGRTAAAYRAVAGRE